MAERNPYVLLAVPFGASRDVASSSFTRKAKGLRRQPGGSERLTELTWALNQIETVLKDPDAAVDIYRIPADPDALMPAGEGLFNPPAERLERRHEMNAEAWERLRLEAGRDAVRSAVIAVGRSLRFPDQ